MSKNTTAVASRSTKPGLGSRELAVVVAEEAVAGTVEATAEVLAVVVGAAEVAAVTTRVGIEPRSVFESNICRKPVFNRPRGKRLQRELLGSLMYHPDLPGFRWTRSSEYREDRQNGRSCFLVARKLPSVSNADPLVMPLSCPA
jgi:hypothetical protein